MRRARPGSEPLEPVVGPSAGGVDKPPAPTGRRGRPPATKQLIAAGLGLLALLVMLGIDYRRLADRAVLLYVAAAAGFGCSPRVRAPDRRTPSAGFSLAGFRCSPRSSSRWRRALFLATSLRRVPPREPRPAGGCSVRACHRCAVRSDRRCSGPGDGDVPRAAVLRAWHSWPDSRMKAVGAWSCL